MKLFVGLGNPVDKYINNRHNVGHQYIEFLIKELTNIELTDSSSNLQCVNALINNKEILLCKSDTFMNQSGSFVKKILDKHQNIKLENLYIVHDDLDIPLGKFKIDKGTGPKLHNGIKSIEETIKSKDFWRIRIGVDARRSDSWIDGEKYVLSDFTKEEQKIIKLIFPNIIQKLSTML